MPIFFILSGPPTVGYVNAALVVSQLWAPLNANSAADAVWWTEDELYQWIDEAAKKLARRLGVFVDFDNTTIQTTAGQKDYTLPVTHIATIQADLNNSILRARNVQDLEALDSAWTTAASDRPKAFLEDTQGLTRLTLYPPPSVAFESLFVGLTFQRVPDDVAASSPALRAPAVLQDYFWLRALAEARAKETNASMEEVSQWLNQIADQYEQVMRGIWD